MTAAGERTLNWIAQGDGEALLFIHGTGGNAAVWWQQLDHFAARHRVVAYDLPGFGRSTPREAHELPGCLARDAAEALDQAGVQGVSVIAHSLGGWSGLRLALEDPDRVHRLVLSCTPAGLYHPPAIASYVESAKAVMERGLPALALTEDFAARNPARAYLYRQLNAFSPPMSPERRKTFFGPETLLPLDSLAQLRCPVLMLCGELDPFWPPESLEGLLAHFPQARLEVIPGTGHSPYFERPDLYNAALERFLAEA